MVQQRSEQSWLTTASLVILAVVALAMVLVYTRAIMIPFVVALFIVALVSPIEDFQVRRLRFPRVIAAMMTLLVVLFVIAIVSVFVVQAIRTIASTAGEYSTSFAKLANELLKPIEYIYSRQEAAAGDTKAPAPASPNEPKASAPAKPEDRPPAPKQPTAFELFPLVNDTAGPATLDIRPRPLLPARDANEPVVLPAEPQTTTERTGRIDTSQQIMKDVIDSAKQIVRDFANNLFNILRNTVGVILGLISGVLFVIVFVIFLLAGRDPYSEHSQIYKDVVHKIRRYLGTKVIISAVTGVLVWAALASVNLELAGVFGILTFLFKFIPSIGPIITMLLPIPIGVAQFQSPWPVVLVIVLPAIIHGVLGNIVEPKLMGEGLDLHPVTVLLALSFWGLLWGIGGMFLAAPITAAIRIVLLQFDTLRPIGNLLAGDFARPNGTSREKASTHASVA